MASPNFPAGPILGGIITNNTTWRWIYLFNGPASGIGIAITVFAWPKPPPGLYERRLPLSKLDWPGAILLLAASTVLVFVLQQVGTNHYKWNSPVAIACLVIQGICWVGFCAWAYFLESGNSKFKMEPIFPPSLAITKPCGPALL